MTCIIVDDHENSIRTLKNFLALYCPHVKIVAEANCIDEAKKAIVSRKPDLVFLDIELENNTTFQLLNQIEVIDFLIIFVTAHSSYSLDAIKQNAIDYLLKPLNPRELVIAVNKAQKQYEMQKRNKFDHQSYLPSLISLSSVNETYFCEIQSIVSCRAENTYTHFTFINNNKTLLVTKPIKYYEERLFKYGFFRTHKSHLINSTYVSKLSQNEGYIIEMKNGEQVPLAKQKREAFLDLMNSVIYPGIFLKPRIS